ncbi:hypothetical protein GCM10009716_10030 [Streptomyces sodiiphilus]|uniref:Pesticidal protein Cry26Aa n=1 Tax=Streptomyces sodiiphilus TaxID=226217 RepID=A0ABP5A3F1_9ACTN
MVILDAALLVLAASLLVAIFRLLHGPTEADKVVAVDYGFVVFVAAVALLSARLETMALVDLVLIATLLGFLSTVALARRVERGAS